MLQINKLSKTFGKIKALDDVQLELQPGHIYGLVGPNGCGKTTLIKSILGLTKPDAGSVVVQGKDVFTDDSYRSLIGYLPQMPDYPAQMTLKELVQLLEEMRDQPALRTNELLTLFKLEKIYDRPFGDLSGGTKQRVGALLALCFDSPILILDEPTVGLDPLILVPFKKLIQKEAQRGKLVLLVSHVLLEMEQLADQFLFMLDGRIGLRGDLKKIQAEIRSNNQDAATLSVANLETLVVRWMEGVS